MKLLALFLLLLTLGMTAAADGGPLPLCPPNQKCCGTIGPPGCGGK